MNERATTPAPLVTALFGGLLLGLVLGAGFGVVEMAIRISDRMEPSVARRVLVLLAYSGALYGLYGLGLGLLASLASRWSSRPRAAALAIGLAGLAFAAALIFAGPQFREHSGSTQRLALLACALAALATWFLIARFVPERWIPRLLNSRNLAALGLVAIVFASTAILAAAAGEEVEPFAGERGTPAPNAPNIVFVLVDTLRTDVLGTYGDDGGLTPNLDALAARGAVFERVLAPTSWTLPSMASLFTSQEPWMHGMVDFNKLVPSDTDSLPKALGRAGYDRRAFVGNGLVNMDRGFSQGFEHFDVYNFDLESHLYLSNALTYGLRLSGILGLAGRSMNPVPWIDRSRFPWLTTRISFDADDELITDRVLAHVRNRSDAPLFLYVHYGAPHSPYTEHPQGLLPSQPPLAPEFRDELWERYRAETAWTDAAFGRLLEGLTDQGILDNALIVFTADHGEEFLEHGKWEHGHGLHAEVLNVPWIVAGPGVTPGSRFHEPVRLVDIAPTLLAWAGVPQSPDFRGDDHSAALASGELYVNAGPIFGELTSRFLNPDEDWFSVSEGRWKVIRRRAVEGELLDEDVFDLELDPQELAPIEARPMEVLTLFKALDLYETLQSISEESELSEDQLRAMQAMGYMDAAGSDADE